jgi:hypothetical protein
LIKVLSAAADRADVDPMENPMDVGNIASVATSLTQQQTTDAVGVLVLKKAMQIQADSAVALIEALPTPTSSLPAHLGQNVNTTA